jgi:hypothetical protein
MHLNSAAAPSNLSKISILYLVEVLSELFQECAHNSSTYKYYLFERIVVSGIAKILKYKDTFKIAKP